MFENLLLPKVLAVGQYYTWQVTSSLIISLTTFSSSGKGWGLWLVVVPRLFIVESKEYQVQSCGGYELKQRTNQILDHSIYDPSSSWSCAIYSHVVTDWSNSTQKIDCSQ